MRDHAIRQLSKQAEGRSVPCKICAGRTELFDVVDFAKTCALNLYPAGLAAIPVYFRRCGECAFIFTDFFDDFTAEQWGTVIYNDDYARVDPDFNELRPAANARVVDALLRHRRTSVIGLDYGGGSGRTCRHLREMGYAYDTCDPFGERWLTPSFENRYDFCTAFEVAEHTPDPRGFFGSIVNVASKERLAILVGTQTHDDVVSDGNRLAWWYAAPRNGHISLYSRKSLQLLAEQLGLEYTCFSAQTHLLTRGWSRREAWFFLARGKVSGKLASLLGR